MTTDPLVSTIIPAFNAAGTLREAVRSVLSQGIDAVEVIIVDDGSTDATRAVAEELALGDERVWVLEQPNRGVSAARNTGVNSARGAWLHFLDADDWMLPGGLRRLIDAAHAAGTDAACAGSALFDEQGRSLEWSFTEAAPADPRHAAAPTLGVRELLERNRFQPAAAILRRSTLEHARFDDTLEPAEDWDLWLRLGERGVRWATVHHDVAAYRLRRAGASRQFARMAVAMRSVLERAYERCRSNHATVVPASALRHDRLEAALRRAALHQATAAALDDPSPDASAALTVLVSAWPGTGHGAAPLGAEELAEAAYWMIPFADGLSPRAWESPGKGWLPRAAEAIHTFWSRCAAERMLSPGADAAARERLAELAVSPCQIARAMARRAVSASASGRPVTLIGLGRNAAHLATALRDLGIRFDARDDALAARAEASFASIGGREVEVLPGAAPYNPSSLHLVTPTDDAAVIPKLPAGVECVRWSEERLALAAERAGALASAWPGVPRRIAPEQRGRLGAAA